MSKKLHISPKLSISPKLFPGWLVIILASLAPLGPLTPLARAELKYETPHPFIVAKNSETKCGVVEDAQALLTEATAFMKQYWDIEKPSKEQLDEVLKKMRELEEKVFYLQWCYDRHGDWAAARLLDAVIGDMGHLQRRLWHRAHFPQGAEQGAGQGAGFPFPGDIGGDLRVDIDF